MSGFGSAALAAAKLWGSHESGKLKGAQRAREEVNAKKAEADAERRGMLDEMIKKSTLIQNTAGTVKTMKETAGLPSSWLDRGAAKPITPRAPRQTPEEIEAEAEARARGAGRGAAPFQRPPAPAQPRADPAASEARQNERDRRAYVLKTTKEYLEKGDPVNGTKYTSFSAAKAKAESEADEVYGQRKALGDPRAETIARAEEEPGGEGPAAGAAVGRDADLARQAEAMIASGEGTYAQAMASKHLSEGAKAILRQRRASKPTGGRDRY